jgi:hypothetical protein
MKKSVVKRNNNSRASSFIELSYNCIGESLFTHDLKKSRYSYNFIMICFRVYE